MWLVATDCMCCDAHYGCYTCTGNPVTVSIPVAPVVVHA
jgi:uncharacterized CHY-type Zn-finger protein